MTTNETTIDDEMNIQLEKAKKKDINIQIEPTISRTVNFLDLTITNENGKLRTLIYHKPTAEPYILPYTSDHPRHIHRNIPYAALVRAARFCSHVDDFNSERIRIDMSLLLNEYPPDFIKQHFNRFFHLNNAMSVFEKLDQTIYQQLHNKLLSQSTRREKQLQKLMHDPVKDPEILKIPIWDIHVMYPKYIFDSSLTINFPKAFYQWWKKHFIYIGSNVNNVKVRLSATTNRTLEQYFIHKKPPRELLTKMEPSTT
jgi:hypothetical protein